MSNELRAAETASASEPSSVVVFPLWRRADEVRRVAMNLAVIAGTEEADDYRFEIADRFFRELAMLDVPEFDQDELVGAFFHQVDLALEVLYDDASESVI